VGLSICHETQREPLLNQGLNNQSAHA